MLSLFYNVLFFFAMTAQPAICDFVQSWNMPCLDAGYTVKLYPQITSGACNCSGLYIYTHKYSYGDYVSPGYMSMGPGLPESVPIFLQDSEPGQTFWLWTKFECLTCGHSSKYRDSGVIQSPD